MIRSTAMPNILLVVVLLVPLAAGLGGCNGGEDDLPDCVEVSVSDCAEHFDYQVFYADRDEDGYGVTDDAQCLCEATDEYTASEDGDCDDEDDAIHPYAVEVCDGEDNDCDDDVDEDVTTTFFADDDDDGHGDAEDEEEACAAPRGYVATDDDCDDERDDVYPGAHELCDGVDNDCDEDVDEGFTLTDDEGDELELGDDCGIGACEGGTVVCSDDGRQAYCDGPGRGPETCDDEDNDCDGETDEDFLWVDHEGTILRAGDACGVGACAGGTVVCNEDEDGLICETPEEPGDEVCDGEDNDCDGETDEGFLFVDADRTVRALGDSCGIGACAGGTVVCNEAEDGTVCSTASEASDEVCGDEIDNDCDGEVNEGFVFVDWDGTLRSLGDLCGTGACADGDVVCNGDGDGLVCDSAVRADDEVCDDEDNDCDGDIDEELTDVADSDCTAVDGVCGEEGAEVRAICVSGEWLCDYSAVPEHESGPERSCDGLDNNCDGEIDEGFADSDDDGVADCVDNCAEVENPDQENSDDDEHGDACDVCPEVDDPDQADVLDREVVTYVQEDYSEDEDCIEEDVCLYRDGDGPVYNTGEGVIEWACGACGAETTPYVPSFRSLRDICMDGGLRNTPGHATCLHIVGSDVSWDVYWFQWSRRGGGFGYVRSRPRPDGIGDACDPCPTRYSPVLDDSDEDGIPDACDNCPELANPDQEDSDALAPVEFVHPAHTDDEDCLGDDVCLTRDVEGPIYNNGEGEISWACGVCGALTSWWYDSFGSSLRNACFGGSMPRMVGRNVCLWIHGTDTFWTIYWTWWQSGEEPGAGGGFSYVRYSNSDGVGDLCDNCWTVPNPGQIPDECSEPPYDEDPMCGAMCYEGSGGGEVDGPALSGDAR